MPEGRLNLAQAMIALALAPKSNAVITAIDAASADVRAGKIGPVPAHLRDAHYGGSKKLGHGQGYLYAHDEPFGIAEQQYAPDVVADADLLPADHPRRRGRGQGAVGAGPPDDPRPARVGSVPMNPALSRPVVVAVAAAVGGGRRRGRAAGRRARPRRRWQAQLDAARADLEALSVPARRPGRRSRAATGTGGRPAAAPRST